MQTTTMLLRSSSLECLLAHPELAPEARHEGLPSESHHAPMSVSLHSCRGGSLHLDSQFTPPSRPSCSRASCSESPSYAGAKGFLASNCIRKAQSENDLCSLTNDGGDISMMSARVAANTLLQDSRAEDCTLGSAFDSCSSASLSSVKKQGRALPPLSRWRSLGSPPSELPSIFWNGDPEGCDFAILEEGELTPSSLASSELNEERNIRSCIFDKIALPVGKTSAAKVENDVTVVSGANDANSSSAGGLDTARTQVERDGQRHLPVGLPRAEILVSSSGRQEDFEQSMSSVSTAPKKGRSSTGLTLEREGCNTSLLRHMYHGDDLETACSGGDGGRRINRPVITGGEDGGGSDAGGLGASVTEQHYQRLLQEDPGNPLLLRNYAQYLVEVKQDYDKAEEFFQRAILASPSDGELLGQYAKMLWEVKHDTDRASTYFERAAQAAPDNSYVMAAYASFLWNVDEEEEGAGSSSSKLPSSFPSLVSIGLA